MAINPETYDISVSGSSWDRLIFRVEHRLLSPGTSDMAKLRGYLRVKAWRDASSTRERLHLLKVAAKLWPRAVRDSLLAVRAHGGRVEAECGVSPARQVADLVWLRMRHGILPPSYYIFRLYRPAQLRRAPNFFQENEDDEIFRLLNLRTAPDEADLLLDKVRFERWLIDHGLPTVRTLMELSDGEVVCSTATEGLPRRDLFSKPNDSLQGFGTERWRFEENCWVGSDGRRLTESQLIEALKLQSRTRAVILQEQLRNHHTLAPLAPATLSTVRVLTLRGLDGRIRPVIAACKIPVGGATTDHMRLGGVAAPIDLATGRLGPGIRKAAETFITPCQRHPDTGAVIEGFQLPLWDRTKELAIRAHEALDRIVCVGWDVAILEDGPVLIEGNDNPGHTSSQWPTGIPLGETEVVPTVLAELRAAFDRTARNPSRNSRRSEKKAVASACTS